MLYNALLPIFFILFYFCVATAATQAPLFPLFFCGALVLFPGCVVRNCCPVLGGQAGPIYVPVTPVIALLPCFLAYRPSAGCFCSANW
jgi:hypothetical protein